MSWLEWFKARWKWVAAGTAVLLAVLVGLFTRRRAAFLPAVDTTQKKVEEKTAVAEQVAAEKRDVQVKLLEKEHDEVIQKLTDEQREKYQELRDNPEELSGWLLDIGKSVRKN